MYQTLTTEPALAIQGKLLGQCTRRKKALLVSWSCSLRNQLQSRPSKGRVGETGVSPVPWAINEDGEICGQARGAGGYGEAILLTPVPVQR